MKQQDINLDVSLEEGMPKLGEKALKCKAEKKRGEGSRTRESKREPADLP